MDSKILLGKILQRFKDRKISQYKNYTSFGYIHEGNSVVRVTRERGSDTDIPFSKLLKGIEIYKTNIDLYDQGPGVLQQYRIRFVNSAVHSLLHLLEKEEYK